MKRMIVFEDSCYGQLLPLVYWRSVGQLRCGRHTLLERIEQAFGAFATDLWVRADLQAVSAERHAAAINEPLTHSKSEFVLLVNARFLPQSSSLQPVPGTAGVVNGELAYAFLRGGAGVPDQPEAFLESATCETLLKKLEPVEAGGALIDYPWSLIENNERCLRDDWSSELNNEGMAGVPAQATLIERAQIRIARGARIMPGAVIDASGGPVEVGEGSVVSPLAILQGPCHVGERCVIQPGAIIRPGCSIGSLSKIGGELEGTIIHGYSNKQHDGFLGHSYVAEWVNLGADTVNSDLKNTYGPVRVPVNGREIDSGRTFVGVFIGDHAKTGIGQTFATGSVVGFGSNVATSRFAPRFVPSFSWLTDRGAEAYDPARCLEVATRVMARRQVSVTPAERKLFKKLPGICRDHEMPMPE